MEYEYAIKIICNKMTLEDVPIMFREKTQNLVADPAQLLEYSKTKKWNEIKTIRDTKETSGCPFKGSVLDSDERSVTKINTAVQSAQIYGENFSIDWTMQDNSVITLTYEDMLAVPLALASWSNYLHQHARGLKAQIDSATTIQDVLAVEWGETEYSSNDAL